MTNLARLERVIAARRERAEAEARAARLTELCAELRAFYHPKQRAFYTSTHRRKATNKTRRSGATSGGCRELIARALETPRFRAVYATTTRIEAKARAWLNDTQSGFVDIMRAYGEVTTRGRGVETIDMAGVTVEVRPGELQLQFSNGSLIELFGADDEGAINKLRGLTKHVWWIDEAQDFTWLERLYKAVISAGSTDFAGEVWLTGTPSQDCVGFFYDVTRDDEPGLAGWEVHAISVVDNPYFARPMWQDGTWYVVGREGIDAPQGPYEDEAAAEAAAVTLRWERTAGDAIRENAWRDDDPDLLREWYAKWVKTDARYVYPVHAVPRHIIQFSPQRLMPNPFVGTDPRFDGHPPWYDHDAAVRDLPVYGANKRRHKWLYALWFDFGFWPDPFAAVLWAFTPTLPDVYEMFSWKQTRVHADDTKRYMKLLWDVDDAIMSFGGDAAGKQADFAEMKRRLDMPIEEANKAGKATLEELLAGDIRRGYVHLRESSPLYTEMSHLVYLPTKPGKPREVFKHRVVNGVVHGDHCCDAGRYGFADLTHYLAKIGVERPKAGSREALLAEERDAERRIDEADRRLEARHDQMDEDDDLARYYKESEVYEWT
jgi:hypothetical protein